MEYIVTQDHWRYGESEEAGNRPALARGERVELLEDAGGNAVYVRTGDGRIERASREALRPAETP